ncbi:hypothetical protein SISSUDRAFT_1044460 [Sistotremastrum suecicum HHB10207 ss-3]|uniref:Uncharacterized protein n=1 Tax=Sistotremastrum suecicum HHB10207 ss-3 TaxID=1314776 RepID=A0A166F377_9AGAM|nr:hypothetical protein SISSUDRAFT_1044460 [Sistotremastrum suecicum HHB10207 ss-3]
MAGAKARIIRYIRQQVLCVALFFEMFLIYEHLVIWFFIGTKEADGKLVSSSFIQRRVDRTSLWSHLLLLNLSL